MELHDKIRTMREINHWSQEEMAEKLAMSTNGYAKIERGQTKMNIEKLQQIAQIFNVNVSDLIEKEHSLFFLFGDHNNHNELNNYNCAESVALELEKLKLMLSHSQEMVKQKESEILALKDVISLLKSQQN